MKNGWGLSSFYSFWFVCALTFFPLIPFALAQSELDVPVSDYSELLREADSSACAGSVVVREKLLSLQSTHRVMAFQRVMDELSVFIILKADLKEVISDSSGVRPVIFSWASATYFVQGLIGVGQAIAGVYILTTPLRCNEQACREYRHLSPHHAASGVFGFGFVALGLTILSGSVEHFLGHTHFYQKVRRVFGRGTEAAHHIARQIVSEAVLAVDQRKAAESSQSVVSEVLVSQAHFDLIAEQLVRRDQFLSFELDTDSGSTGDSSSDVSDDGRVSLE